MAIRLIPTELIDAIITAAGLDGYPVERIEIGSDRIARITVMAACTPAANAPKETNEQPDPERPVEPSPEA